MSFTQGAPTQPLSLVASSVFLTGSSTTGNALTVQQLSTGNVASFQTSTSSTALIINPSGNVGIGKTNPGYALDVTGDINFSGTFRQNGSAYIGSQWTGTTSLYFVGNVGINTTSVANPLTVGGTVAATTLNLTNALAVVYGGTGTTSTSQNFVFAGPPGAAGAPTFRALASGDIPNNAANTTGTAAGLSATLAVASGGTGTTSTSQNFVFAGLASGTGAPAFRLLVSGDIPTLNQNTTGTAAGLSATLAVASGGTGVTSSTGSGGSVVLSANPTFTGTASFAALNTSGNVGIGIANPTSYTLTVAGTIGATGNITAFTSDKRLKKKTGKIENALDKVLSLEGFTYIHNELAKEYGFTDDREYVGLSAQDLQEVLPEVVFPAPFDADNKSGQNFLTVQYERIVPLLVEAIKEQNQQIKQLEKLVRQM